MLSSNFHAENQDGCDSTHLFVSGGAKMNASLLRTMFSRLFHRYTKISITFQDYCHVVTQTPHAVKCTRS